MEKYELKNKYEYEDDEIDLVELLKAIVRERKIVAVITVLFTVLSLGFVFYKSTLPKVYTAEFLLKNNSLNITLKNNNMLNFEELEIHIEKIKTFTKSDEINNYLLKNDIFSFKLKDTKDEKNGIPNNIAQIIEKQNTSYFLVDQTKNKNLIEEEKRIKNELILLNENIDKLLNENINKEILNTETEFKILSKKSKDISERLQVIIKKSNLNILSNNIYENLLLIDPVLYTEFKENENRLSALYSDLKTLNSLSKNYKEIINLEFKEIKFENQKLNNSLIVIIGIIFGLFAGMFIAIIKEPLKNIIKEIREEK